MDKRHSLNQSMAQEREQLAIKVASPENGESGRLGLRLDKKNFLSNIRKMHEGELEYEIRRMKEEEKRQQFIRDIQQQIEEKRERKGKEKNFTTEKKETRGLSRGGSQATTAITNDATENLLQFKSKSKSEQTSDGQNSSAQLLYESYEERRSDPNQHNIQKGGRAKVKVKRAESLLEGQGGIFDGRDEKAVLQEHRKKQQQDIREELQ